MKKLILGVSLLGLSSMVFAGPTSKPADDQAAREGNGPYVRLIADTDTVADAGQQQDQAANTDEAKSGDTNQDQTSNKSDRQSTDSDN